MDLQHCFLCLRFSCHLLLLAKIMHSLPKSKSSREKLSQWLSKDPLSLVDAESVDEEIFVTLHDFKLN